MLNIYKIYRAPEGDGGGGSGGGGAAAPAAAATPAAAAPAAAAAAAPADDPLFGGAAAPAAAAAPVIPGAPAAAAPVIPENWKQALPEELRAEASLTNVPDVQTLVKNYISAQKMIGADKIAIPGKHATEAEWKEAMHKLGNPRDSKEYIVELDKGVELDKDFFEKFKSQAHSMGILPRQAKTMATWFAKLNTEVFSEADKAAKVAVVNDMKGLKTEWGDAYDVNIVRAKAALNEFGDADTQKFVKEAGLGQSSKFIKFLAKAGASLSEDSMKKYSGTGSGDPQYTPSQANEMISEIKLNPKHPYWDAKHENHIKAKKEMNLLFEMANPSQKRA